MRALAAALLVLAALAAPARAAGIDDCEKISDADAYNRCLAAHGPAYRGARVKPMAPGARAPQKPAVGRATRADAPARVRGIIRPRGGRTRRGFTVAPRGRR